MGTLNSYPTANLSTTQIPVYTCGTGKAAVLIGSNIANKTDTTITVDIKFRRSGTDYMLLKSVFIPPYTAYISSGDEQKTVLNDGDSIQMVSDTVNSADVLISVSEFSSTV